MLALYVLGWSWLGWRTHMALGDVRDLLRARRSRITLRIIGQPFV